MMQKLHLLRSLLRIFQAVSIAKVRKWGDTYLSCGFHLPNDQSLNAAPMPKYLICSKSLSNMALASAKLQRHLQAIQSA